MSEHEDHTANIPLSVSVPERLAGTGGEHVLVRLGQPETSAYARLEARWRSGLVSEWRAALQGPVPQPPAISRRSS